MRYSEIISESSRATLFHGMALEHALTALTNNELLGLTTQRWWPDGRRRTDSEPDYHDSYWMKGVSLTRDANFAKSWGGVVLELDQEKLKHRFKIIPFNWLYSNANSAIRKKEREEFLVVSATPDKFMRELTTDDIEASVVPTIDMERFTAPGGKVRNLDSYIVSIRVSDEFQEIYKGTPELEKLLAHPKFVGSYSVGVARDHLKRSTVRIR